MSKKTGKPAARKTPAKQAGRRNTVTKSARASRATARLPAEGGVAGGRTLQMTIFLFRTGHGNRIRTTPQRLYANPGDSVEWTVVNLIDGSDVPVTLTWPKPGPWGKEPIEIRNWSRKAFGSASGCFKFVVSALDVQEDPEMEIPDI